MHYEYFERLLTSFVQGLIFFVAAIFILHSLAKVRKAGQVVHLKWLIPMAIYTIEESITYAIGTVYALLDLWEPEPLNTIIDVFDDVSLLALLGALIALWRIIRNTPDLVKTPWTNSDETPEGVWPPAPKAR